MSGVFFAFEIARRGYRAIQTQVTKPNQTSLTFDAAAPPLSFRRVSLVLTSSTWLRNLRSNLRQHGPPAVHDELPVCRQDFSGKRPFCAARTASPQQVPDASGS